MLNVWNDWNTNTKRNETTRFNCYSSTSLSVGPSSPARQPVHAPPPRTPPRPRSSHLAWLLAVQILADRQTCRWVSIQTFRLVLLFKMCFIVTFRLVSVSFLLEIVRFSVSFRFECMPAMHGQWGEVLRISRLNIQLRRWQWCTTILHRRRWVREVAR